MIGRGLVGETEPDEVGDQMDMRRQLAEAADDLYLALIRIPRQGDNDIVNMICADKFDQRVDIAEQQMSPDSRPDTFDPVIKNANDLVNGGLFVAQLFEQALRLLAATKDNDIACANSPACKIS